MLTLLLGIGCVSAQVVAGFDADRGDDPNYEDMIAARSTTSRTVAGMTISDVQRLYDVFAMRWKKSVGGRLPRSLVTVDCKS